MARRAFIDPRHEERLRTDGYVILDLLRASDVEDLLELYDGYRDIHEHEFTPTALLDDLDVRETIHERVGATLAERILPVLDDYTIAVGSFAVKGASTEYSKVGLHQDLVFVDEHESEQVGLSIWCPLVEVNSGNGCLGVVWGSHTLNNNYREPTSLPYYDLYEVIQDEFMTYLPMQPGQVLLMDNRLFHGSEPNRSNQARVVAAGIAVPREAELLYCHRDYDGDDSQLEIWSVPSDFYVRHKVGRRPQRGELRRTIPRSVTPLTESDLRQHMISGASVNAGAPLEGTAQ